MTEQTFKSNVVLSKTKYKEFDKHLKELVSLELYLKITNMFKDVFKYDSEVSSTNANDL
jgi:hypothetical protein